MDYKEVKELVQETYLEYIEEESYIPSQALAATLEDFAVSMKKNVVFFIAVVNELMIISLAEKLLPDYLEYLFLEIEKNSLKGDMLNDVTKIERLLNNDCFRHDVDFEYLERIRMIFQKKLD